LVVPARPAESELLVTVLVVSVVEYASVVSYIPTVHLDTTSYLGRRAKLLLGTPPFRLQTLHKGRDTTDGPHRETTLTIRRVVDSAKAS